MAHWSIAPRGATIADLLEGRCAEEPWGHVAGLLDTHASIVEPELRRQSRLLAVSLAVLTAIFFCVDAVLSVTTPGYTPPWAGYVFLLGTLALNRAGHYRVASALAMAMFPVVGLGQVYLGTTALPLMSLGYVALAPMLGAIFLPIWGVVLLTAMNLVGIALAPLFVPELETHGALLLGPLSVNAMIGVLASLYMHHRNGVEADRRKVLLAQIEQRKQLEERLRQAEKLEELGKLAGGVAHDFNNVLMVILGNVAILSRRAPSPELQQIEGAASSAAALTRQLLAFARRAVIEPTVLDVGAVVRDAVGMVRRIIGEHVNVEHVEPSERLRARLDRAQIEHVILNLATNARDAMQNGGTLRIDVQALTLPRHHEALPPDAPEGRYVCIRVADDGVGMDEQTRQRIFEPFFTTKGGGRGTGLGLASVFGIVSQSGGFIRVWSEPGRGSRFELYFPRAEGPDVPAAAPQVGQAPARGVERVLLVEDDDGVRGVVKLILADAGYDVVEACSLRDARACWSASGPSFALVITDLVLADGRGLAWASELRVTRAELPVLCMSGYGDQDVDAELPVGFARLQKPFGADELLVKVRALLGEGAKAPSARGTADPPSV